MTKLTKKQVYYKASNAKTQRIYFNASALAEYTHLIKQPKISEYVINLIRRDMAGETAIDRETLDLMKEVFTSLKNGSVLMSDTKGTEEVRTITQEEANAMLNLFN